MDFRFIYEIKSDLYDWEKQWQRIAEDFNNRIEAVKRNIVDKKAYKKTNFTRENRLIVKEWSASKTTHLLTAQFNWRQVGLFMHGVDLLFRKMEDTGLKQDVNTVFDLLNLVFVSPRFKYWTFDNKKLYRCLKADANTKDYFI